MTHPYLSDLPEPQLKRQVVDAKLQIQKIVGIQSNTSPLPEDAYDQRTLQMARQSRFATVTNSRFYANAASTSPYELGRVAMLRHLTIEEFGTTCRGRGLWKKGFHQQVRRSVAARARKPHLRSPARGLAGELRP